MSLTASEIKITEIKELKMSSVNLVKYYTGDKIISNDAPCWLKLYIEI